jgi:chorismate mutase
MKKQLEDLRKQIDEIDNLIVDLLAKRMKVVEKVGVLKKQHNVPPLDPARWQQVLTSKMEKAKSLGLDREMVKKIYNIIHEEALKIEEK